MGFSLNLVSLLAITLVTGILVDDAIVEIENIVRHMKMGKSPYKASIEAADEIGLAVMAITLTIVAIFAPVSFMGGIAGQYFKQFGLVVAAAVLFSLLVARLITPMMTAYFLRPHHHVEPQRRLHHARLYRLPEDDAEELDVAHPGAVPPAASSCVQRRLSHRRGRLRRVLRLAVDDAAPAAGLHAEDRRGPHRHRRRAAAGRAPRGHRAQDRRDRQGDPGDARGRAGARHRRLLADGAARDAQGRDLRAALPQGQARAPAMDAPGGHHAPPLRHCRRPRLVRQRPRRPRRQHRADGHRSGRARRGRRQARRRRCARSRASPTSRRAPASTGRRCRSCRGPTSPPATA